MVQISFNTQPPEGGWRRFGWPTAFKQGFNTQPPEGGWGGRDSDGNCEAQVSTHSRPKAAGGMGCRD